MSRTTTRNAETPETCRKTLVTLVRYPTYCTVRTSVTCLHIIEIEIFRAPFFNRGDSAARSNPGRSHHCPGWTSGVRSGVTIFRSVQVRQDNVPHNFPHNIIAFLQSKCIRFTIHPPSSFTVSPRVVLGMSTLSN